jgi:hypothetical protein
MNKQDFRRGVAYGYRVGFGSATTQLGTELILGQFHHNNNSSLKERSRKFDKIKKSRAFYKKHKEKRSGIK